MRHRRILMYNVPGWLKTSYNTNTAVYIHVNGFSASFFSFIFFRRTIGDWMAGSEPACEPSADRPRRDFRIWKTLKNVNNGQYSTLKGDQRPA